MFHQKKNLLKIKVGNIMTLLRKTASKMERGIVMNIKNFEGTNKNIIE